MIDVTQMMTRVSAALLFILLAATPLGAEESESQDIANFIEEDGDRVPLHTVVPVYPKDARRDRIEGEVQVCYYVDKRGRPYRIGVRNSTHRIFERPSLRAVRASSYQPLGPDEKTSGIKTCRTFRFQLQPVADASRAERRVLDMSMTMVMGPTPPGTGVTADATFTASS